MKKKTFICLATTAVILAVVGMLSMSAALTFDSFMTEANVVFSFTCIATAVISGGVALLYIDIMQ